VPTHPTLHLFLGEICYSWNNKELEINNAPVILLVLVTGRLVIWRLRYQKERSQIKMLYCSAQAGNCPDCAMHCVYGWNKSLPAVYHTPGG
jgi:hypothetical protein